MCMPRERSTDKRRRRRRGKLGKQNSADMKKQRQLLGGREGKTPKRSRNQGPMVSKNFNSLKREGP